MKFLLKTISGHLDLSQIEIEALAAPIKVEWLEDNFCRISCTEQEIKDIIRKSASLRLVVRELSEISSHDFDTIINELDKYKLQLPEGKEFAARVFRINKQMTDWNSSKMEKALGGRIFRKNDDLKVNFKQPDFIFALLVWEDKVAFGFVETILTAARYNWKAPKTLPHFRGGAIKPVIARFIINMHKIADGDYVIDPFCGHGGTLYEIADVGYKAIGIELDRKVARQAQRNARSINYTDRVVIMMGDALKPPFRRKISNYYTTDPPYSLQTTTKGRGTSALLLDWFEKLENGVYVSFALPTTVLEELPDYIQVLKSGEDFVHKTLIRRMRLVRKWMT